MFNETYNLRSMSYLKTESFSNNSTPAPLINIVIKGTNNDYSAFL